MADKMTEEERLAAEQKKAQQEQQIADASSGKIDSLEKRIKKQLHSGKHFKIRIPSGRSDVERSPVPVGLNGIHYLIQRDKEVVVPEGVVKVLMLAMEEIPVVEEHNGFRRTVFQKAQRIPVTVLGECEPDQSMSARV